MTPPPKRPRAAVLLVALLATLLATALPGLAGPAAAAGPTASAATTASTAPVTLGTYLWKNRLAGLCLDVTGALPYNGAQLVVQPCSSAAPTPSQKWTDGRIDGTRFTYTNSRSRMCLSTADGRTTNGTPAVQGVCRAGTTELWDPARVPGTTTDERTLRTGTGMCLDTESGRTTPGTPVVIGLCTGSASQKWVPTLVSDLVPLPRVNRVGIHNAYDKDTAPSLRAALDSGAGMIELDLNGRGAGQWDVYHPGWLFNNCGGYTLMLQNCLEDMAAWHANDPAHNPVVLKLEMKTGFTSVNNQRQLNNHLAGYLGRANIVTPDDLRCVSRPVSGPCAAGAARYPTPDEAVRRGGWPTFNQLKGKFLIYVVHGTALGRDAEVEWAEYTAAHPESVAFPGMLDIDRARTADPRDDTSVLPTTATYRPWFVVLDGGATGIIANSTIAPTLRSGHYLVTATGAQTVLGIDHRHATPEKIYQTLATLTPYGVSITSSDWATAGQCGLVENRS